MSLHDKLDRIRLEHLEGILSEQTQKIEETNQLLRANLTKSKPV